MNCDLMFNYGFKPTELIHDNLNFTKLLKAELEDDEQIRNLVIYGLVETVPN